MKIISHRSNANTITSVLYSNDDNDDDGNLSSKSNVVVIMRTNDTMFKLNINIVSTTDVDAIFQAAITMTTISYGSPSTDLDILLPFTASANNEATSAAAIKTIPYALNAAVSSTVIMEDYTSSSYQSLLNTYYQTLYV